MVSQIHIVYLDQTFIHIGSTEITISIIATIEALHKTIIIDIHRAIYTTRTREFARNVTLQEVAIALIDGHNQTILPEIMVVHSRIRQTIHIGIKDKFVRCTIGEVEHRLLLILMAIPFIITIRSQSLQRAQLGKIKKRSAYYL